MRKREAIRSQRLRWRQRMDELQDQGRFNVRLGRQCVAETRMILAILQILHGGRNTPLAG